MHPTLSMLLLCTDEQSLSNIDRASKVYNIHTEACLTAAEAMIFARRRRFDLVVVDLDLAQATDLLRHQGTGGQDCPSVVIGLTAKAHIAQYPPNKHVHLVVQKPFTASLMERTLRSAYRLLLNVTRSAYRLHVEIAASAMIYQDGRRQPLQNVILRDLSSTGVRLTTASQIARDATVFIDFQLPGNEGQIHAVGKVIWTGPKGNAGIQFLSIAAPQFERLKGWLSTHFPWTPELALKASESNAQQAYSM